MNTDSFLDARVKMLDARTAFLEEVKRNLVGSTRYTCLEELVYPFAPFGKEFQDWMQRQGVEAKANADKTWSFWLVGARAVQQGDAVTINLLNSAGTPEDFSGQVIQVVIAADGSRSYIVACPFQVGPEHIRVIVPVEDLEK